MAGDIELVEVRSRGEFDRFVRLPMRLNAADPAWVAPLIMERKQALSTANPFFDHADARFWLAVRDGRDVGRISAQIDHLAPPEARGAFGLIAAEDEAEIFAALLATAEGWLATQGITTVRGPFNLSVNEEVGLLVDGFRTPPMLLMGHDPPYAAARLEACGYAKARDLYAYLGQVSGHDLEARLARARRPPAPGVRLRTLDMSRYGEEVATLTAILNDAWRDNWGFTPTTEAETRHLAQSLRPLIDPKLIWFAEIDGEPAGVLVLLPNLNEAIADLDGRLAPFGWARLLWRLKVKGVKTLRAPLMGVRKAYAATTRGRMLPFQMIARAAEAAAAKGYRTCEFSWVLEENHAMRHICEAAGARIYKTYRIYEKAIA